MGFVQVQKLLVKMRNFRAFPRMVCKNPVFVLFLPAIERHNREDTSPNTSTKEAGTAAKQFRSKII